MTKKKAEKQKPQDERDLQKILAWFEAALIAMRLPPATIRVEKGKIRRDGECFTAEIEPERDYLDIKVKVDLDRLRKKPIRNQRHLLCHELCHYVMERFDRAIERYIEACFEFIPPAQAGTTNMEKLREEMESEGEKLTDHIAFLALPGMPPWEGI